MGGQVMQKQMPRGDVQLAPFGRNTRQMPPGFEKVASQSRPGEFSYMDSSSGTKYQTKELAWQNYYQAVLKSEQAQNLLRQQSLAPVGQAAAPQAQSAAEQSAAERLAAELLAPQSLKPAPTMSVQMPMPTATPAARKEEPAYSTNVQPAAAQSYAAPVATSVTPSVAAQAAHSYAAPAATAVATPVSAQPVQTYAAPAAAAASSNCRRLDRAS